MKQLLFILFLALCAHSFSQQAHMTISSGQWDDPAIWNTGAVPLVMDFALVRHEVESSRPIFFGPGGFLMVSRTGRLCVPDSLVLVCGSRFENHGTLVTPLVFARDGINTGKLVLENGFDLKGCNYGFTMAGEVDFEYGTCSDVFAEEHALPLGK